MNRTRHGRNALTVVLVVLGALGVLVDPSTGLVAALIMLPLLAGIVGFAFVVADAARIEPGGPPPTDRAARVALGAAGVTAAVVAVPAGVAVVVGDATGPVLLLAAFAVAPWAWSRLRPHVVARLGRDTTAEERGAGRDGDAPDGGSSAHSR